jgi:hypothetical protein
MTDQEIFDTVVAHLRKQGVRATDANVCRYRTASGLKCAVGCLLTDEEARQVEGFSVDGDYFRQHIPSCEPHIRLLRRLQSIHDVYEPEQWESQLRTIANEYELEYRAPSP